MGALIDSVLLTPLAIMPVAAGDVMHAMRRSDVGFTGFGEVYFSCLNPGAIKAWKCHRRMTLNLIVPAGQAAIAVVDNAARRGRIYELGPSCYFRLTVPPGLWVGFKSTAITPSIMLNVADLEHDQEEEDRLPEAAFSFDWQAQVWPSGSDQAISQ